VHDKSAQRIEGVVCFAGQFILDVKRGFQPLDGDAAVDQI
jgi:hypothetical protein